MTSDTPATPPADTDITVSLVTHLLEDQFPELLGLPVKIMDAGWDNVMVRVGDDMALRLPRRAVAAKLILNEQKWLPWLAPQLPLLVPVPLGFGVPTPNYPYPWSMQSWLPGAPADLSPPMANQASVLVNFLKKLHTLPAPKDVPQNSARDCGLAGKKIDTEKRMQSLSQDMDIISDNIWKIWCESLEADMETPSCFIAGDIHARNVLTQDGKLSAIIDWGDMCLGDPATDLASIWGLFESAHARQVAIEHYGMSPALLARSKGWAVFFGTVLLETGRKDTPRHAKMGQDILRRLDVAG